MDLYNIWLALVIGANVANGREIVLGNMTPKELYERRRSWIEYDFFTVKQMERALTISLDMAIDVQRIHTINGIMSINYTDDEYPECLKNIPSSPVVLFYKGDISLLSGEYNVGVIGTRNPDRDGLKICGDICTALSQNNVTIISGLAQGLDGQAHISALNSNGKTIAFIGTSLDKCYPAMHRNLQKEICEKGCVVSEYPTGSDGYKSVFLERNRLIAATSKALCVIQAKEKSGSLSTAKRAEEYSKQLFAVPGNITNPLYDGTNTLIQLGAIPLIKPENVLDFLGIEVKEEKKEKSKKLKLTQPEQKIYDALGRETKSTQQIFEITKLPIVQIKALLTKMELDGVIVSKASGVYCKK